MPAYTCGSLRTGNAKMNKEQLTIFTINAIAFVNFEPPLSTATRLSNPEK